MKKLRNRVIKRRQVQIGPVPANAKLREQREQILGRVAYEHMLNANEPTNSLQWPRAISIVQEIMQCDAAQATEQFREIAKETGLITEERPNETFRFIHLTFCEFLAAFEAVNGQEDGWRHLIDAHAALQAGDIGYAKSRLLETIPFACGLLPRVKRIGALNDLADMAHLGDRGLLARVFLETKRYDHRYWPVLVEDWKAALLRVHERDWNDEWLRDLHLFNVVVADAVLCATHMTGSFTPPNLDGFFENLVAQQQESLFKLLRSYAAQDAVAAFRLAELNHLDLALDFPEIVLANCDQDPFFAMVLEQAVKEPAAANVWGPLLAEAGLRSRVVGEKMAAMVPIKAWEDFAMGIPKSKTWTSASIVNRRVNFFTQCLTSVSGSGALIGDSYMLVKVLQQGPFPGAYRFIGSRGFLLSMLLAVIAGAVATVLESNKSNTKSMMLVSNGGLAMMVVIAYYIMFRTISLMSAYHRILYGISPSTPHLVSEERSVLSSFVALFMIRKGQSFPWVISIFLDKALRALIEAMAHARSTKKVTG